MNRMNRSTISERAISILVLVAWIPMLLTLFPLPSTRIAQLESIAQNASPETEEHAKIEPQQGSHPGSKQLVSEVWRSWVTNLVITALGVVAAFMAVRRVAYWRVAVVTMSSLFLLLYLVDLLKAVDLVRPSLLYVQSESTIFNVVQTKIGMVVGMFSVTGTLEALTYAFVQLFLPPAHLLLIMLVAISWIGGRGARSHQLPA